MSVNNTPPPDNIRWNRRVYHRLKLSLSLGLRRQIFVAVCDDLNLRNQVASRLQSTLAYSGSQESSTVAYPRFVTLRLNLSDPNPISQINQWLARHPPPIIEVAEDKPERRLPVPAFQILGIEQLTGQPVAVQRLFFNYLRLAERNLSSFESSLVLWVSRPWLKAIEQSVPQFWGSRTGVFVFAGEPTPTFENHGQKQRNPQTSEDVDNLEESLPQEDDSTPEEAESLLIISGDEQDTAFDDAVDLPALPISYVRNELTQLVLATTSATDALETDLDDEAENLQPRELLEQIEELHSQQASSLVLAAAYQELGNLYRQRIEQGQTTPENLTVAILAYNEAITYFPENSAEVPDILNDIGTLYWILSRTSPTPEQAFTCLEQGIQVYELALTLISPASSPQTYARVQNNLGAAYGDIARFADPAINWQRAVLAYAEALRFRPAEAEPSKYAATQNNLGTAYWHLAQQNQPAMNLKQAIAAYSAASAYYNPAQEPLNYGMIQNNIGTAFWNLAQYEKPEEYLRLAIDAYKDALTYRTPDVVPTACAATQNNLGTAYWHLANQPQTSTEWQQNYLQLCITAYEEALTLAHSLQGVPLSFDVFATHNNLGLAHYQVATDKHFTGDKATLSAHLQAALDNHLQALQGYGTQPDAYQSTVAYVVKTVRAFHSELGLAGQNLALSKVPGSLLPEILPKL